MDECLQSVLHEIHRHYGERLLAVALFGSRARPHPRVYADWDLLLALDPGEPIRRRLYTEWERGLESRVEALLPRVSPHFVHLPRPEDEPSGFWLEVALSHQILKDPSGRLATYLDIVRRLVRERRFEAREVHGFRYWRRAS